MIVVVIDDDPVFLQGLRETFPREAALHLCDPAQAHESGMELVRAHPDARVFLGAGAASLRETLPRPKRARPIGDRDAARDAIREALAAESPEERRRRREDEHWLLTDLSLRERLGGQAVVIHGKRIWASGDDVDAAVEAALAMQGCPPVEHLLVAIVPSDLPAPWPWPLRVRNPVPDPPGAGS